MVRCIWESPHKQLAFHKHKKYFVYFPGCFSPPHRGHFETIEEPIMKMKNSKNIHVFVHQMGEESRHGVPYQLSKIILQHYIDACIPKGRVTLRKYASSSLQSKDNIITRHAKFKKSSVLVILRGDESVKKKDDELKTYRRRCEKSTIKKFSNIIKAAEQQKKQVTIRFTPRPLVQTLSATKFTEALLQTKNADLTWTERYTVLQPFYPHALKEENAKKITDDLDKCKLIVVPNYKRLMKNRT
jgi:hypothetical protein